MMYKPERLVRRTKIIATLGPATDDPTILEDLISAGVNIVRLNFSHGTQAAHQKRMELVRQIADQHQKVIGILVDLQGPKIRVSGFKDKEVLLKTDDVFVLDAELDSQSGTKERVGIDYKRLPHDVVPNDILLLDDGRLRLKVERVNPPQIFCRVLVGGILSSYKGINRQGGGLSAPALTEKDKIDMQFALKMGVDFIAISFPRNAADILYARQLLEQMAGGEKNTGIGIIAKIERTEAVVAMDEIIEASDGVMVARGDLAVEIGDAEVPLVQKSIIESARRLYKPVIIATQMMESMINNSVPTRAEVSDVANAVLDHADAVMLSAETASGHYPVTVVESMSRICQRVEQSPNLVTLNNQSLVMRFNRIDEAIAMATMYTANHLDIKAIVALTESGMTPLWMSRIRTAIPIYGLSRDARTLGKMALYRGVFPVPFDVTQLPYEAINRQAIHKLYELGVVTENDLVILTQGDYAGIKGRSNAMKILRVSEVL